MRVSHETIYRSLFVQARGVLKKELVRHLRTRRTMRRFEYASPLGQNQGPTREAGPTFENYFHVQRDAANLLARDHPPAAAGRSVYQSARSSCNSAAIS